MQLKKLTIDNNDNLTSLDAIGSEINDVTFQNNSGIETVVFDHTTELNYVVLQLTILTLLLRLLITKG